MSAVYQIHTDGYGDPCLFRYHHWGDRAPTALARKHEVPPELWPMARLLAHDEYLTNVLAQRLGSRTAADLAVAALRDMAAAASFPGASL